MEQLLVSSMNDFINKIKDEYQNKVKTPIKNKVNIVKKEIKENSTINKCKEKIKEFFDKKWN